MVTKNYMSGLFGRSPITPLQEHMYRVYRCVRHLTPLIEGMVESDEKKVLKAHNSIAKGEHDADKMKHELRTHLPKGLFMPVDRRDVLDVLLRQDMIANQAKDISALIVGRKMQLPAEMNEPFQLFTNRCVDSVKQALQTINELDELVETGFRGLEVDRVEAMLSELGAIESETDTMQDELRATLFKLEKDLGPVDVIFTYRLIDWVGNVADNAERVGSRLSLMLAR
ncbi:TIGR00153 family protein [uncultured Cocleimonas sp.]|uniref:TIGR00153 family protein n=1 Tax=uncultured Cocleimonas sp. TaxID=1051587 RepID=UPI0026241C93|nr:TIGR00153 family protein [uncultured Cocleimonas sp.]